MMRGGGRAESWVMLDEGAAVGPLSLRAAGAAVL